MGDGVSTIFSNLKKVELILDTHACDPEFRKTLNKLYEWTRNDVKIISSLFPSVTKGCPKDIITIREDLPNKRIVFTYKCELYYLKFNVEQEIIGLITTVLINLILKS